MDQIIKYKNKIDIDNIYQFITQAEEEVGFHTSNVSEDEYYYYQIGDVYPNGFKPSDLEGNQ